jgi:hypothetical protein
MPNTEPKSVEDLKKMARDLVNIEGASYCPSSPSDKSPCKFYYRYNSIACCLMKVYQGGSSHIFTCLAGESSNCTPYINFWHDLELDDLLKKNTSSNSEGCYIATACYGSYDCNQVITFRSFRDDYLCKNIIGRRFIRFYYAISPIIAQRLKNKVLLSIFIRDTILNPIYELLKKKYSNKDGLK